MSQTPLLSIVAAVYNGEKFLAQFFECLEQQQLESYELILVNDGSTDNSLAVIAEWRDRLQNVQVLEQGKPGRLGRAQYRPRRRQRQISGVSGYRRQTLSGHVSHAAGDGRERTSRYRDLQRHLRV